LVPGRPLASETTPGQAGGLRLAPQRRLEVIMTDRAGGWSKELILHGRWAFGDQETVTAGGRPGSWPGSGGDGERAHDRQCPPGL